MAKLLKVLAVIMIIVVVAVAGLAAFVRIYLTDERIKSFVLPRAEKTMGRAVAIGEIEVSLLRGITIKDFAIREAAGPENFVTAQAFILRYELLPLLRKKLAITEIRFDKPTIRLHRDAQGKFNFETLAVLEQGAAEPRAKEAAEAAALPVALTVKQIRVDKAHLTITDELGELPATMADLNLLAAVDIDQDLAQIRYQGETDFAIAAEYGQVKPRINGRGKFDQDRLTFASTVNLDQEMVELTGAAQNYTAAPSVTLNVSSKVLDIDHLLALAAGLPKTATAPSAAPAKSEAGGGPLGKSLPAGLVAKGTVKVDKATYQGATVNDFALQYLLEKGILAVKELAAATMGGSITGDLAVNLNIPELAYQGRAGVQALKAGELMRLFAKPAAAGLISGELESALTFDGAGRQWPRIRQALTADGTFALRNGQIRDTAITKAIAMLLNLPELNDLTYDDIAGTLHIEKGQMALNTDITSRDIKAQTDGIVGLDGKLDLPVTLRLSPALSDKLKKRAEFTKYLLDRQGETVLRLKLAGTVSSPRPTLDVAAVQEQIEEKVREKVKEKALEKLEKALPGKNDGQGTPGRLLKDLLGR